MTPTSDQLKDLLGKVTQGDWEADELNKSGLPSAYINAADGYPVARAVGVVSEFETAANATLIALAPTLADEVVRLRTALVFYAEHHQYPDAGPWGVNSNDYGNIARQALAEK